jgi:uncharacterized RmlC-like cupin family protein
MAATAAAGVHTPENVGKGPVDALLIEFKAKPGTATVPPVRPGMTTKVLVESPYAVAVRTTADPSFREPAGTTHEFDQVVVSLSSGEMALSIDGKPPRTTWARGDVQFIGRGVPHESQNASGKPIDFIIVMIR